MLAIWCFVIVMVCSRVWVLLSAMDYLVVVYRGSDLTGAYTI